jgi:hypothetical protein
MNTRILLLAAAASIALTSAASAQTAGYIDLSYGGVKTDTDDLDGLALGGAAVFGVGTNWAVQLDADATRLSADGAHVTLTDMTAHVYYQKGDWAFGGTLAAHDYVIGTAWSIGLEAQKHLGPVVLEAGISLGTIEVFADDASVVNGDASATWYCSDNFSIGVGIAFTDIDGASDTFESYGADAEYKFESSQLSAFGGYAHSDAGGEDADIWRVGLRFAFGEDSLKGRRTTGPRWQSGIDTVLVP